MDFPKQRSWDEEQLETLRPYYPDWHLWTVHCWPNYIKWCAGPAENPVGIISVLSPEELIAAIAAIEAAAARAAVSAEYEPGGTGAPGPGGRAPGPGLSRA